jgi:ParB-like chromosome segregation protein Spo0J
MAAAKKRVPASPAAATERKGVHARVRIGNLVPSKINPRKTMDEDFVITIGEQMTDTVQLQPMAARPTATPDVFEVFIGHTRLAGFNAMVKTGKITLDHEADIMIYEVDDREAYIMAIAENVVRRDMPPLQECAAVADALANGVSIRELSRETGLKPGEINDRIAVTRADEKIRLYVANGDRTIAWVGRFSLLSKSDQHRVHAEIDRNPGMYRTVRDLNDLARQDKIPVRNAIFDVASSGLATVSDMMDPDHDWFEDRQAFWDRQNLAIQERVVELERTGQKVEVLRSKPFLAQLWRPTDSPRNANAFIVVADDGAITVHDKLLPASEPDGVQIAHDSEDHATAQNMGFATDPDVAAVAPAAPEPVRTITNHPPSAKAAKAALARMRVDRAALCVIQNSEYAERLLLASFLGDDRLRTTPERPQIDADPLCDATALITDQFTLFAQTAKANAARPLDCALSLPIAEVRTLNAIAVAMRLENQRGPEILFPEDALVRDILRANVPNGGRGDYLPNEAFFKLMNIEELRNLTAELLSEADAKYAESAPKNDIVTLISDRFREAANGDPNLHHEIAFRLNAWWPAYL